FFAFLDAFDRDTATDFRQFRRRRRRRHDRAQRKRREQAGSNDPDPFHLQCFLRLARLTPTASRAPAAPRGASPRRCRPSRHRLVAQKYPPDLISNRTSAAIASLLLLGLLLRSFLGTELLARLRFARGPLGLVVLELLAAALERFRELLRARGLEA